MKVSLLSIIAIVTALTGCAGSTARNLNLYNPIPDGKYADWGRVVSQMTALSIFASICTEDNRVKGKNAEQYSEFILKLSDKNLMSHQEVMLHANKTSQLLSRPDMVRVNMNRLDRICPTAQQHFNQAASHYMTAIDSFGGWQYK